MIPMDADVQRDVQRFRSTMPHLANYVETWYKTELMRLPHATNNTAIAQGRCQVLKELHEALSQPTRQS